jgi:Concanavalin A-like lectin/glucanases superfamily
MKSIKIKLSFAALPLAVCIMALSNICVSAQTLVHRYSFNDAPGSSTFADSVGGADGTLQFGISTNAVPVYLNGSQLVMDGSGGYGLLPAGLISSLSQVSIEFWVSYSNNPVWTRTFAFGDQTSGGGANSSLDYCHYAGGNYQNLNIQTNGPSPSTYVNNPAGLNGQTNVHVTVVVDPVNNRMYYYNGTVLMSSSLQGAGVVYPLSAINDTYGTIGRSLFDVDPTLAASIDEFRIYSGVLSPSEIALDDAAGPNSILTSPGTVQSLNLTSPSSTVVVNGSMHLNFFGNFSSVSNLNLIAYGGASFTSGDTNVLTVNPTNGLIYAVAPGATTITGSYASLSTNLTITVVANPPVLTHRYSFTSDASDSIGGANGTLEGTASVTGGQLVLDGSTGCYLSLPGNAINISTNSAVTFDTWVAFGDAATWAELFAFGNTNNGNGVNNIACVPCADAGGFHNWGLTENLPNGKTPSWAHGWHDVTAHITCVLDPPTGTISVYRDGVLEVAEYDADSPISGIATNYAFIGRSLFNADPYLSASIDEFRIYNGALTPEQVALSQQNGPNVTNLDVGTLSSIVVVATNYPAYASLVAPVILANYANLTNFNLLPTVTAGGNTTLNGPHGLVVTSSDPSIVSVNAQNMLTTHEPGTVTLTASYDGQTSSATIQVENGAVLTHRYSFTSDASDSIGGANGTLMGTASISGGQLQLDGGTTDYLNLPGGMLSNYTAVTVDTWVNFGDVQNWSRLWEFFDQNSGGIQNEMYFAPGWNPNPPDANFYSAGFPWGNSIETSGALNSSQNYHITCEYGDGQMLIYTDAVLMASLSGVIAPASSAGNLFATIGFSPYGDPGIDGSVDEFRIYKGLLSPEEIAASDILGPNQLLTTSNVIISATQSGGNSVISWPLAAAGFSLQMSSNLLSGSWITLTNTPVLTGNTNWQITVPASGSQQFYRLRR